ncbi:MAG: hypothetical protein HOO95_10395 [Gallionella sp.]|nr:hypothetical protein [Gallionella sp.]
MPNTQNLPDYDVKRVVEKPDGFYWQDIFAEKKYGPFLTRFDAVQDMLEQDGIAEEDEDGLLESANSAEDEIGIADWVDPDTGELAEESHTHISDN